MMPETLNKKVILSRSYNLITLRENLLVPFVASGQKSDSVMELERGEEGDSSLRIYTKTCIV